MESILPRAAANCGRCKRGFLLGPEDAAGPGRAALAGSWASGWKQQLPDSAGSWWLPRSFHSPSLSCGFEAPHSPFKCHLVSNTAHCFLRGGSGGTDGSPFLFLQKPRLKEVKGPLEGHTVLSGKSVTWLEFFKDKLSNLFYHSRLCVQRSRWTLCFVHKKLH